MLTISVIYKKLKQKIMKSLIKIALAAILVLTTFNTFAKPNADDRHLSGFKAVNVAGSFDVYITQGATESVKIEAPASVKEDIVTEVQNGVLKIHNKDRSGVNWHLFSNHSKATIYVTVKDINSIELAGSGNIFFKEGVNANTLQLRVSGSGSILGKVTAKSLESAITGSGDIKVTGHVDNSKVSVTGSGNFSGRNLATNNTTARVVGSGDADVNVIGSMDANVTGSGDIRYTGSPKSITKSKAGSGDISRL